MTDGDGSKLGFWGAVSIAVGGMIGGGVFAVLGVVTTIAGAGAWLAFALACLVSTCAAYSYLRLNRLGDRRGGSVSQLEDTSTTPRSRGWSGGRSCSATSGRWRCTATRSGASPSR